MGTEQTVEPEKEKAHAGHIEYAEEEQAVPDNDKETELANEATFAAKETSLKDTLRVHWRAAMWSVILSTSIIMEGYDLILLGNFLAYPEFKKNYGHWVSESAGYQVDAEWQTALNNAVGTGAFVGLWFNGYLTDKFGHRKTLIAALSTLVGLIFIVFFAPSVQVLFAGEVLCGVPWGMVATIGVTYASEVCPVKLRGYLANYINLCWVMGQLIAAGVLQGCIDIENEWSYRIPFALQWLWPPIIITALIFAPDSPWWLVRHNRIGDARKSLRKLNNCPDEENEAYLALIIKTNELEISMEDGASFLDCFKGANLRRTEISCFAFACQIVCASGILYTPTYFFEQAGLEASDSYKLVLGSYACGFVGNVFSWFLISKMGHRTLFVGGMGALWALLLIEGLLTIPSNQGNTSASWAQAGLALVWLFTYSSSIGPLTFTIISETSSSRLRNKTVCLARNTYYVLVVVAGTLNPRMLNPGEWNWKGFALLFWCGPCGIFFIWSYFRIPECKNRTYEELDLMFENGVKARKFKSTDILHEIGRT